MSKLQISSIKSIWQTAECSYVWIGILQVRYIANHIIRYQIGDGTRVSLWYNPWLADGPRRSRFEERVRLAASIRDNYSVSALIVDGKWDLPQTRCAGVVNIRQEIRTIDLPPEDRAVWRMGIWISDLLGTLFGIQIFSQSMLISCGMQKTYQDIVCRRESKGNI